jgi:YHS domain-containing protein
MQATDPVCRMTVDTSSAAAQGTYDGQTVYFCSVACQKSFEKSRSRTKA